MKLTVDALNLTIGDQQILKDISVQTQEGQFVGLIGSNGSGKSTLLKAIYKTLKPDSGEIHLGDMNILKSTEKKVAQQVSVVSQFNELSFDLTVEQMVLLGRTPHKSGGEKQRVVLARAITQEPRFMILDEPTNHLDIRYQLDILETVKALNIGILAALHNLEQAANYCDIIYALKDGQVIGCGTPETLLTESLIEEIYGVKCSIYHHPITGGLGFHYYFEKE